MTIFALWPWERKAYQRGFDNGVKTGRYEARVEAMRFDDQLADALKASEAECAAKLDEQYRELGQLLSEARRDLPADSPLHDRINKALARRTTDAQIQRIATLAPSVLEPRSR